MHCTFVGGFKLYTQKFHFFWWGDPLKRLSGRRIRRENFALKLALHHTPCLHRLYVFADQHTGAGPLFPRPGRRHHHREYRNLDANKRIAPITSSCASLIQKLGLGTEHRPGHHYLLVQPLPWEVLQAVEVAIIPA